MELYDDETAFVTRGDLGSPQTYLDDLARVDDVRLPP
jgi:hypothetical protein